MANAFSRSWGITKLSFGVIKKDKELILFPIMAFITSAIYILAMLFPSVVAAILQGMSPNNLGAMAYVMMFLTYLGLAFIATFFNVCVVYTTKIRFEGGNATFFESIKFAMSKVHLIFSWSMLAATVGLILGMIDRMARRAKGAGKIVLSILRSVLGLAWSIITIFVVPGMVYHNLGPVDAIKKSVQTLKKTWGESLIRYYGLGLVQMAFVFLGVVVAIPIVLVSMGAGPIGLIASVGAFVMYFIIVGLVFAIANSIFSTALYVYADTGKIPQGYSKEIMEGAFRQGRV